MMNKEIQSIIQSFEDSLKGEPWYGRAVYAILDEIEDPIVYTKPNQSEHSLIELLYHMLTWAEFTLKRLQKDKVMDLMAFEKLDWREIKPSAHSWEKGLNQLKETHEKIIALLQTRDDSFLDEIVDYRSYDFRYLLNGLIQHNIYHVGQVAYVNKLLA